MIAEDAGRLLNTLQQLLEIEATHVTSALGRASDLLGEALRADKVDIFILEPETDTLVALGTSATEMARLQRASGLDRLPLANGGSTVTVFQSGEPFLTAHADQEPTVLPGVKGTLGVRSLLSVALDVAGVRRGVLSVASATPDRFSQSDLHFVIAAAQWIGAVVHRAELVERLQQDAIEEGRQIAAADLIAVLAHDLGNYVTPVRGRLDLMRRRAARDGRERDVSDIGEALRGVGRIQRLISDLLDATRLEQGFFEVTPQTIDLAALTQETAEVFQVANGEIQVRAGAAVVLDADPDRIRQILENLLSNAVKYSRGLPVMVEVFPQRAGDGRRAVVTVQDQGPGIGPEMLPFLFDRFRKGPESKGLGLGLYLARCIAEAHGGSLEVESNPDQGTTFRLSLPAETGPQ